MNDFAGSLGFHPDEYSRGLVPAAVAYIAFVLLGEDADLSRLAAECEDREDGRDDCEGGEHSGGDGGDLA